MTPKVVALVDALGNLVRLVLRPCGNAKRLPPGRRRDSVGVPPLTEGIAFDALTGDKGFDNGGLRAEPGRRGAGAVIPPKANRKAPIPCDFVMGRRRHLVENFFCDLKQHRRAATRHGKTDQSFVAMIHRAAIRLALQ